MDLFFVQNKFVFYYSNRVYYKLYTNRVCLVVYNVQWMYQSIMVLLKNSVWPK